MSTEVTVVLAPNPGPMTLEGTNSYVLRGTGGAVVIDPGPLHEGHLCAIAATGPLDAILLTHSHPDHAAGAARLRELTGAPLRPVKQGEQLRFGEISLAVMGTPGHTGDSVSFLLEESADLLTGDTILGRGTTVVAHPDGRLADYLDSLARIAQLPLRRILPGHGPEVTDPSAWVAYYRRHRAERLDQVRAAVAAGATTASEVVAAVYSDVDPVLWPAATLSVLAQLDYLAAAP